MLARASSLLILSILLMSAGLGGCGSTGTTSEGVTPTTAPAADTTTGGTAAAADAQPVRISGDLPPGTTQVRVSGLDVEGDTVFSATQAASKTMTVTAPSDARTILLEYLDDAGVVIARYVESETDSSGFSDGINDPPFVLLPAGQRAQSQKQADASEGTVTGSDVKFSFAFVGCNRAREAGAPPVYSTGDPALQTGDYSAAVKLTNEQLTQAEKNSTANVSQLRQHFEDVRSLNPRPRYIFLCGDVITKGKLSAPAGASADWYPDDAHGSSKLLVDMNNQVAAEEDSWKLIRSSGATVIDQSGARTTVTAPPDGSLFSSDVRVVVLPGNHEMCYKIKGDPHGPPSGGFDYEYPNKLAGPAFVARMQKFIALNFDGIRGISGPRVGETFDAAQLSLPDDPVARDESQLSYAFQDGENFFIVLNTDTYVGDSKYLSGGNPDDIRDRRIPLRWLRTQLYAAQSDATVKHIFVFGHRPIGTVGTEAGIASRQAKTFYQLLNNPLAQTDAELALPSSATKVRGYFCAHAHLFSSKQRTNKAEAVPLTGPVQQIVCGTGGSSTDPVPSDEGQLSGATASGTAYPWYGFSVVAVRQVTAGVEVDTAFFGRNVHPSYDVKTVNGVSTRTLRTRGFWWEQEPLKLRGQNISGPGIAPPKSPKDLRRLYLTPANARYVNTFTDTFSSLDKWVVEEFKDPGHSPCEYHKENVTLEPGGGVRITVTKGHLSSSEGRWFAHSGRLRSTFSQKYGLFVFRARQVPRGSHLWPALWTVGRVGTDSIWPQRGEIDVMEAVDTAVRRPDFTSRLMCRSAVFPPASPPTADWFASLPADSSLDIKKNLTEAQWREPHTFAVDWYEVRSAAGVTDVRYDIYMDVVVNADGRLVGMNDPTQTPTPLHSYSLAVLVSDHNRAYKLQVPDQLTLNSEWSAQAMVLNVCTGGAWDTNLREIESGAWQPPTDGSADLIVEWVKCYQRTAVP